MALQKNIRFAPQRSALRLLTLPGAGGETAPESSEEGSMRKRRIEVEERVNIALVAYVRRCLNA